MCVAHRIHFIRVRSWRRIQLLFFTRAPLSSCPTTGEEAVRAQLMAPNAYIPVSINLKDAWSALIVRWSLEKELRRQCQIENDAESSTSSEHFFLLSGLACFKGHCLCSGSRQQPCSTGWHAASSPHSTTPSRRLRDRSCSRYSMRAPTHRMPRAARGWGP